MSEPEKRPSRQDITIQIFSVSAGLLGVCVTVLGIYRAFVRRPMRAISRDLLVLDALSFMLACLCAYLAMRLPGLPQKVSSWAADLLFMLGLVIMTVVCGFIASSSM